MIYKERIAYFNSRNYTKADLAKLLAAQNHLIHEDVRNFLIGVMNEMDLCSDGIEYMKELFDLLGIEHPQKIIRIEASISRFDFNSFEEEDVYITIDGEEVEDNYLDIQIIDI